MVNRAGRLDLTNADPAKLNFNIDSIFQGQELEMLEFTIENSGSLPYYLKGVIGTAGSVTKPGGKFLPVAIDTKVTLTGMGGEEKVFEGKLDELINQDLVWQNAGTPLIVPAGASVTFKLEGVFNLSAGNEYQESAWEGKLTLRAVQADAQDDILEGIIWTQAVFQ